MKALISAVGVAVSLAQPAVFQPPDNLVIENIPSVPMSLVDSVDRYTQYRFAALNSWHPTEHKMLITTRFADTPQIHLVESAGAARQQLTFFRDSVSGSQYQPTMGNYFVFNKDTGGDEFFQKYRFDVKDSNVTLLTRGKSLRNTGGVWSNVGDKFAYGSTRRNGNDVDIYTISPSDPSTDKLVGQLEGGGWDPLDWTPDDHSILAISEVSANDSSIWLIDIATGEKSLVTPKTAVPVSYTGAKCTRDGLGFYTVTDKDSDFKRLAYVDLKTKNHRYLTNFKWDVEHFDVTKDGSKIAFTTNEAGRGVLHVIDALTAKELTLPTLPVGEVDAPDWNDDNQELGFEVRSARAPNDVYSLNIGTGRISRWTKSETGGVDTSDFSEPELVKWKSFDGVEISGYLYRPPAKFTGKRPLVIGIHGGPEGQFRPGFLGRQNYLLNELGVALLFPNVRGSTGYGKTFLKMDDGFKRADSYKDIGALLDWIKTRQDIDTDRVMVTGGSYGGFMTLAVASNYSDKIRCALDIVGPSNLVTFLENTQGYRRDLRRVEYGDERDPKMRAFLSSIAPANHADQIKKPLFVVQGKNDPRVPASESEQMVAEIRKTGTPVWFLMANDEGHGFRKKSNADYQFYATVLFIQKYLLDGTGPSS